MVVVVVAASSQGELSAFIAGGGHIIENIVHLLTSCHDRYLFLHVSTVGILISLLS